MFRTQQYAYISLNDENRSAKVFRIKFLYQLGTGQSEFRSQFKLNYTQCAPVGVSTCFKYVPSYI